MPKKILIVDDNADHQTLIKGALRVAKFDCDCATADSGEQAVEQAKVLQPEVVVLDTRLPGMNGFDTCSALRAIEGFDAKIIMITGVMDAVDAGRARELGADDYCVKTEDWQHLVTAVKKLF